jgi:hypothetical protein
MALGLRNSSGSFATLAAILRASSRVIVVRRGAGSVCRTDPLIQKRSKGTQVALQKQFVAAKH